MTLVGRVRLKKFLIFLYLLLTAGKVWSLTKIPFSPRDATNCNEALEDSTSLFRKIREFFFSPLFLFCAIKITKIYLWTSLSNRLNCSCSIEFYYNLFYYYFAIRKFRRIIIVINLVILYTSIFI